MKLWDKGSAMEPVIERFTVGEDYLLDTVLLPYECMGSIAHARTLEKAGILTSEETESLVAALQELSETGLSIQREEEDIHTAVEHYLVNRLGDVGKKIHTGRSRNDQVMVDLQLWCRHELERLEELLYFFCRTLNDFSRKNPALMPGYTHMQRAMPSSLQMLTGSYIESLIDDMELVRTAYHINNSNPLGSAAGYGTSLGLDRSYTAALLGFNRSRNCIYVQARGKHMATLLIPNTSVMKTLERIAADLLLFTMGEFGFFTLPERFCTGSSIMPQKKNYDLLELVRARASVVHGHEMTISMICGKLVSGYNRDMQMTKGPLMEAFAMTIDSVEIMTMVFQHLEVNVQKMKDAITPEFFATGRAYELVREGVPFRDAYARAAGELQSLKVPDNILAGREFLGFHDYEPEIEEKRCRFSGIKASPALYL